MRYVYRPTEEEVRVARKREYLAACPVDEQLEALYEAAVGRPEKLQAVCGRIETIRANLRKGEA
jgi:hypothetical protein